MAKYAGDHKTIEFKQKDRLDVFVYLEHKNGKLTRGSLEMLGKSEELEHKLNEKAVGVAVGKNLKEIAAEPNLMAAMCFSAPR